MNTRKLLRHLLNTLTIGVVSFALSINAAFATIVKPYDFAEVIERAELIIEARVSRVESFEEPVTKDIWTLVSFEILDTLKGDWSGQIPQLTFLGGKVGEREVRVAGLTIPQLGETGIYFIADSTGTRAQPLVGWHQGHYLVKKDLMGNSKIFTTDQKPILGYDKTPRASKSGPAHSAARGLKMATRSDPGGALSADTFKSIILEQLSRASAE